MKKQSGFASVEFVVVVVILAAIVGAGFYVVKHNSSSTPLATTSNTGSPNDSVTTAPVPQVNTTSDLSNALNVLNSSNIGANSTDSSQLTTQSSGI